MLVDYGHVFLPLNWLGWHAKILAWEDAGLDQTVNISGEGNGTPLQYSWLENPMDGGAW